MSDPMRTPQLDDTFLPVAPILSQAVGHATTWTSNLPVDSFPWPLLVLGVLASFLAGSVPFGYLIGKWNKVDLRKQGSGNIGATNVWRVLGKGWGTLAFVLDFAKGFLPVLGLGYLLPPGPLSYHLFVGSASVASLSHSDVEVILVSAALAAILGHNFTPWLGFKGGKGVATSAGVLAALLPASFGVVILVWVAFFAIWRIVSVASLAAAVALPLATWFFYPGHLVFFGFTVVAGLLTIVRHKANIGRIVRGEEKRIGSPKK